MAAASWRRKASKDEGPSPEELRSVPLGIDSSTFFSPVIPPEVRSAVPLFHSLDQARSRQLLETVVRVIGQGTITPPEMKELEATLSLENDDLAKAFTGLYTILTTVIRNRVKTADVEKDLTEMHVPASLIVDLVKVVKSCRARFETTAIQRRISFPTVDLLKWRVDVTISSSSLTRVLKPSILFQIFLSDGCIKTFEVPIPQFHQLRHRVAKVLHSMQELERHPIMRLVRSLEAERRKEDT